MKKIILTLCFIFLMSSNAFASCDYSSYCPQSAYDLTAKGSQTFSKVTGMTFLAEKIAQSIIKQELKKATKEKFKVQMDTYSCLDLLQGKFKSMKISGKNLEIDGAYISSLKLQTACDFNYVELSKDSIKFKENMVMNFAMEMTGNDLKKTIQSTGYLEKLNQVNLSAFGITFFKLDGANIDIKNNKLYFTINIISPMSSRPLSIVVKSSLKVKDGEIVFTKMEFVNSIGVINMNKVARILNSINPLTFTTEIMDNKDSKVKINSVDIIENKIIVQGNILIPKNTIKK